MPTKKQTTLTEKELELLLITRFKTERSKRMRLHLLVQRELGDEVREEPPELIALEDKCVVSICEVLARRLKQNRRTTSLFSSRDYGRLAPSMMNELLKIEGRELETEERKVLENYMKVIFENLSEMMKGVVLPGKNIYDEYWRWTAIVLDLASERGISPTDLLALEGPTDEITRRLFTKEQFIVLSTKVIDRSTDAARLKKAVLEPMFDLAATRLDQRERRELRNELEKVFYPKLCERLAKTKEVLIKVWLGEEVKRIYGA